MAWQEWSQHVLAELKRGNSERESLKRRIRTLEIRAAFAAGIIVAIQFVIKYML